MAGIVQHRASDCVSARYPEATERRWSEGIGTVLWVGHGVRAQAYMLTSNHHTEVKGNLSIFTDALRKVVILCLERCP